jgi:hypothetical protein
MAGFLENSFKLGTPARGGGDLLAAFLGINTNPDVQLKGQLAGARLGNLDARTRRANILGNQEQIKLKDMETLRRFITPEGTGVGGLNEQYRALADPNFNRGQAGLTRKHERERNETSLARLAESGFEMEIQGPDGTSQRIPLVDILNTMSGADFKAFATTDPTVRNLTSLTNTRDRESALRQILLGKKTETEGWRAQNQEAMLPGTKALSNTRIANEKITELKAKFEKWFDPIHRQLEAGNLIEAQQKYKLLMKKHKLKDEDLKNIPAKNLKLKLDLVKLYMSLSEDKSGLSLKQTADLLLQARVLYAQVTKDPITGELASEEDVNRLGMATVTGIIKDAENVQEEINKMGKLDKTAEGIQESLQKTLNSLGPEFQEIIGQMITQVQQPQQPGVEPDSADVNFVKMLSDQGLTREPPPQLPAGAGAGVEQGVGQAQRAADLATLTQFSEMMPSPDQRTQPTQDQSRIGDQPPVNQETVEQFIGRTREQPTAQRGAPAQPQATAPIAFDKSDPITTPPGGLSVQEKDLQTLSGMIDPAYIPGIEKAFADKDVNKLMLLIERLKKNNKVAAANLLSLMLLSGMKAPGDLSPGLGAR